MTVSTETEARIAFPCLGSHVSASLTRQAGAERALADIGLRLEEWHRRLTRFDPGSELSRLNANSGARVEASDILCRFAAAAVNAAAMTGGLVDPTLVEEIEAAGYIGDLDGSAVLPIAPVPRRAAPSPEARWQHVKVDLRGHTITRPPGVKLDSGGIAKGLFADILGRTVESFDAFAIDCGGDIRLGGHAGLPRTVRVDDPLGRDVLHEFQMARGGVATSGIGRRSWVDPQGRPAHHLLDPSTGRPAFTGVIQATALAPTALEAEALAKAAVLDGPAGAPRWLRYGGVVVFDDGDYQVFAPDGVDAR